MKHCFAARKEVVVHAWFGATRGSTEGVQWWRRRIETARCLDLPHMQQTVEAFGMGRRMYVCARVCTVHACTVERERQEFVGNIDGGHLEAVINAVAQPRLPPLLQALLLVEIVFYVFPITSTISYPYSSFLFLNVRMCVCVCVLSRLSSASPDVI